MTPEINADKWYRRWWSWSPSQIIAYKMNKRALLTMWKLAVNRCVFGSYRYELPRFGVPTKPNGTDWNFPAKIQAKLDAYVRTHNKENLVDILNYLVWEWERPTYKDAFFRAQDQGIEE